jgi:BirA family biotin operon repressor/biotin-[acetyl-CoA-carboxylase] ligase
MGLMLDPINWLGLSLCVGMDLIKCIDPDHQLGLMLKWPNDVWSFREGQYRKVAGILIETMSPTPSLEPSTTSSRYCILGMGVNLHTPEFPTDLPHPQPIGLSTLGGKLSLEEIVTQLAKLLPSSLRRFEREGFAPFKSQFDALDCLQGLEVSLSDGSTGICQGVNEQGELLLQKNGIVHAHHSSEVSVRPIAPHKA